MWVVTSKVGSDKKLNWAMMVRNGYIIDGAVAMIP